MNNQKTKLNVLIGVVTGLLIGYVLGTAFGTPQPMSQEESRAYGDVAQLARQRFKKPAVEISGTDTASAETEMNLTVTDEDGQNWDIKITKQNNK